MSGRNEVILGAGGALISLPAGMRAGVMGGGRRYRKYHLYDAFNDTKAAGALNGTLSSDRQNTRLVADANSKISITGGLLDFATGAVANDGVTYNLRTREAGKFLKLAITPADISGIYNIGFDQDASGSPNDSAHFVSFRASGGLLYAGHPGYLAPICHYVAATEYQICLVLRATGVFYLIKGGIYTNWTLFYQWREGNFNGYPFVRVGSVTSIFTIDNFRIPETTWLPDPLATDTFLFPNITDGLAHVEADGMGGGVTWVNRVGTVGRSGNAAIATALVGDRAIATLGAGSPHVHISVTPARGTTAVGLVLRYVDADNYVYQRLEAGRILVIKRTGGGETTVSDKALVEVPGAFMFALFNESYYSWNYMNGAEQARVTIGDVEVANAEEMGIIFFDLDSTIDDFIMYALGNDGEYAVLDTDFPAAVPTTRIVYEGDSHTVGATNYPLICTGLVNQSSAAKWVLSNLAAGGESMATILTQTATVDALVGTNAVAVLLAGGNDLAQDTTAAAIHANIQTWCAGRQAAGFRVVVCTLTPLTADACPDGAGGFTDRETKRQAVNTLIQANWASYADALADVASNANIGDPGDNTDLTYYQVDQIHLNWLGKEVLADIVSTAILSI